MPKGNSGIRRGGNSGTKGTKMSQEDAMQLHSDEDYLAHTQGIPDYIKRDMTLEQMQDAIVAQVRKTGESVSVSGRTLYPEDVDGRYPAPKDSRFTGLIRAMNATDMSKLPEPRVINGPDRDGRIYRQLYERVESITSGYSTRELREFVSNELGEGIYRGGRPNYLTTITLSMQKKFETPTGRRLTRNRLDEPSTRLSDFAATMKSHVGVYTYIQKRVADIKAKYRMKS